MSNKNKKNIAFHQTQIASYQGPLPPAAQLEQYDRILPGAADRIITTFEKQVEHRHSIEKTYVQSACKNSTLGILMGGIISLVTIVMSGYLVFMGYSTAGSIIGVSSIASLAGVFVYGTRMKQDK